MYEVPTPAANGTNPTFTAVSIITDEQIFVDRSLQVRGSDYTLSANVITFQAGSIPPPNAIIQLYYKPGNQAQISQRFSSAGDIINDVAAEVGLGTVGDPYTSTDQNFIQLCRLLKSAGRTLTLDSDWTHLRGEFVFTTVLGQTQYTIPPDFNNMIDQTGWNRTNRLPIGGPLTPQEWQYFKARLVGVVFNVLFRQMQQRWFLFPDGGVAPAWLPSHAYLVNATVSKGGNTYICAVAGTSGLVGPSGTSSGIVDGTCVWNWTPNSSATPAGLTVAFEYNSKWWVGGDLASTTPVPWAGGVLKSIDDQVTNNGQTYTCIVAGTTSTVPASTGPTGFGSSLDGSVIWKWVDPFGITTSDFPQCSTDIVYFEPILIMRKLKLAFLSAKGFDTSMAQREYDITYQEVMDTDRPSPVLNLRGRAPFDPLIGAQSVPITGYGN
jgi:hypothetical protein